MLGTPCMCSEAFLHHLLTSSHQYIGCFRGELKGTLSMIHDIINLQHGDRRHLVELAELVTHPFRILFACRKAAPSVDESWNGSSCVHRDIMQQQCIVNDHFVPL